MTLPSPPAPTPDPSTASTAAPPTAEDLGVDPALFPFVGRHLQVAGQRMHVLDEGPRDAPAVLMLHGNPTWSFYYRDLVRELSVDHRCIVPDHIGCGLSSKPGADDYPYTLERRVTDLEAALDQLDVQGPITLVVHDWGGGIGFTWASRHADRLARFVVLNTAAFHLPKSKPFPWPLALTRTPVGAFLVTRFNAFSGVAARVAFKKPVSAAVRHGYVAPYDTPANRVATLRFVQDIPLRPEDPGFSLIGAADDGLGAFTDKPALICWGMRDFVFDKHFLAVWEERWPHAEVHRFDTCGHYVLEDAGPQIRALVRGFVDAHPVDRGVASLGAARVPAEG